MKTTYKFLSLLIISSLLVPPNSFGYTVRTTRGHQDRTRGGSGPVPLTNSPAQVGVSYNDGDVVTDPRAVSSTPSERELAETRNARAQADLADAQREEIRRRQASEAETQNRASSQTRAQEQTNLANAGKIADSPGLNVTNAGMEEGAEVAPSCLPELKIQDCTQPLAGEMVAPDTKLYTSEHGASYFVYNPVPSLNFESPRSCAQIATGQFEDGGGGADRFRAVKFNEIPAARVCRIAASSCKLTEVSGSKEAKQEAYNIYWKCVSSASKNIRSVIVGIKKCAAIQDAAASTTDFEAGEKVGGDPITCKEHEGYAFDYPSCKSFLAWYAGLKASEMGLGLYNEADKTMTGMKAQSDMAKEIQQGNGQTAGLDGAKRSTMAAADAESRNKLFHTTKAAAIGSQLALFETRGSISGTCKTSCCELFQASGGDKIKTNFFPNSAARDHMIAEVIKAGGAAVAAALKEAELKKQAALMQAAKEQLAGPEDESEEGFMKFCQQYPQDVRCLGPGNRLSVGNNGYGSNFQGQNFGLGDLGAATTDEFNTETIAPGSGPGTAAAAVGGIGSMNKAAAEAKDIFNAPPAARGGGAPAAGGGAGGGGAGANASANGLSNDPGVQAEKKEDPLKVTSKKANYDGAAGYSGGSWRPGAAKKEGGAENPFAAMFNKNKGRDIAAAKEIDSPASDLFTKISNRYGEVQKRKGLMEAADTNIR